VSVASYGYARTFVSPSSAHKVDVLLPVMESIDNIKVTVYDDIKKVLAEITK